MTATASVTVLAPRHLIFGGPMPPLDPAPESNPEKTNPATSKFLPKLMDTAARLVVARTAIIVMAIIVVERVASCSTPAELWSPGRDGID